MKFSAGLDLGQANDYSALVVAEREGTGRNRTYTVRLARRWRGLQYTALPGEVGFIVKRPPLEGNVTLKVDAIGVGRAVLNILEQAHGDGDPTLLAGADHVHRR